MFCDILVTLCQLVTNVLSRPKNQNHSDFQSQLKSVYYLMDFDHKIVIELCMIEFSTVLKMLRFE